MLREFRRADGPTYFRLLSAYFPEENALLGYHEGPFNAILRRVFRWDYRLILGLFSLVRRPIVKFLLIEDHGQVAATAILTFTANAGYVGSVMVDIPYRHRGYAQRLLAACDPIARRAGKRYLILDVLSANAPARALYDKIGFLPLRDQGYWQCAIPSTGHAPTEPLPAPLRPLRKSDAEPLADIANGAAPPRVREIYPVRPGDFFVPPLVVRGLDSETVAWVIDRGHGPEGFLRASVSPATQAGHLSAPLIAPGVDGASAAQLVTTGIAWLAERHRPRAVVEVPRSNLPGTQALQSAGFTEAFGVATLYRSIGPAN
jgi:ribosomal protein S18 acetylase RimI-like enzyme